MKRLNEDGDLIVKLPASTSIDNDKTPPFDASRDVYKKCACSHLRRGLVFIDGWHVDTKTNTAIERCPGHWNNRVATAHGKTVRYRVRHDDKRRLSLVVESERASSAREIANVGRSSPDE